MVDMLIIDPKHSSHTHKQLHTYIRTYMYAYTYFIPLVDSSNSSEHQNSAFLSKFSTVGRTSICMYKSVRAAATTGEI